MGLVGSDERWKTVYSVWPYQVRFSGYPNFWFSDFEGLPSLNRIRYFGKICCKIHKFNNLSKTVSLVEIFHRGPKKIINLVKKVVKNRRCNSLDLLDRGIKVDMSKWLTSRDSVNFWDESGTEEVIVKPMVCLAKMVHIASTFTVLNFKTIKEGQQITLLEP